MSALRPLGVALGVIALCACVAPAPQPPADDWLARAQREIKEREYQASRNGEGLQAPNRAHALRTWFERDGIRVHDRTAAGSPALLALRVAGVGRGAALTPVSDGEVTSDGARVEIRRPGLVEWFVNSPDGLEQGFTLDARAAGESELVLELEAELATASLAGDRVIFATPTGRRLSYGALFVRDAAGAELPARFEVASSDRIRIAVDDAQAAYPIVIDPLLTETADAQLESNQAEAAFGSSVASAGDVNGDGHADVIVGAESYDAGQTDEGAAFVFLGSATGLVGADPSTAAAQLESNQTGALFGTSVASAGDVNGDGYADVIVGAPLFNGGQSGEGAAFVFFGSASGIADGNPDTAAAQLESDQMDAVLGRSVAGAGDVNGDGYADVIVGARSYDAGLSNEGAAFVFHGGSGFGDGNPATAAAQLESNQANALLGASVASAGDVNGDGYADVIVGANGYDAPFSNEGSAFVFLGSASGIADGNPLTAATRLESNVGGTQLGYSVAPAGDVNGDGYTDVIVGAPLYADGEGTEGAAFVFLGSASGIADGNPLSAAAQIESDEPGAFLGESVAGAGDVNGDGYADVIVGASSYDGVETTQGVALVFLGGASGIPDGTPATAAAKLESPQVNGLLGWSVASAGDVNGDGYADVIVGAYPYDAGQTDEGAAFIYLGGAQGIVDGSPLDAITQLESDQNQAHLGTSVAGAGDVNGDGFPDVIVGAEHYDSGEPQEGAAFVFIGSAAGVGDGNPTNAATRLEGDQSSAAFGRSVASAGDVNGDGYADVIVGAPLYGAGQLDEGAAFVFLGSSSGIASGGPTIAAAQLESDQVNANLGRSVASAGDVNGDGYPDVIVGASLYDSGGTDAGAAFVFLGGVAGVADGNPATAASALTSSQADARLGTSVASAGDVNGDGYADVIVGAQLFDAGETDEGAAFVFHGSAGGIASGAEVTAAAQLESDQANAELGHSVASAGDVNGDSYADVIVGVHRYNGPTTNEGIALIFHGSATGVTDGSPATAATRIDSDQSAAELGTSVASAGDVNGDGYGDVFVGAPLYDVGATDDGAAFVFLGGATGVATGSPATAAAQIVSGQGGAHMGQSVAGAGDVNGDGFADVIVGAESYGAGVADEGIALVFNGNGNGDGRPVLARQLQAGTDALVQPWGSLGSLDGERVRVRMQATHPDGRGRVKLQLEVCPHDVAYGQEGCIGKTGASWTDVTASSGGVTLTEMNASSEYFSPGLLVRWRARVLHAPFSVTQPGITAPAKPAHGPWRRLHGRASDGDARLALDTDLDGIPDPSDPDDDGDGLSDVAEGGLGTDPLSFDTDVDGLSDGAEVLVYITNPLDPDHDGDGFCDGPSDAEGLCTPGDNCPAVGNAGQQNGDALPAGNACQCGDVTGEGIVNATDLLRAREHAVGRTPSGAFDLARCDVAPGDVCDLADIAVLERHLAAAPVGVANACDAYVGP